MTGTKKKANFGDWDRWLVNELSQLSFSITYDEVNRYNLLFRVKALTTCFRVLSWYIDSVGSR